MVLGVLTHSIKMFALYQNVRGLNTKSDEFLANISGSKFDIVLLTETWLQHRKNRDYFAHYYNVYRRDRCLSSSDKQKGGGVLIAVNKKLKSSRYNDFETDAEDVWVKVTIGKSYIYFCSVYFPPDAQKNTYASFFDKIECAYAKIGSTDRILIAGDFNMAQQFGNLNTELGLRFQTFLNSLCLSQLNGIKNSDGNILDYIISNIDKKLVTINGTKEPLVTEDKYHPALSISLSLSGHNSRVNRVKNSNLSNNLNQILGCDTLSNFNFKKCDFHGLYTELRDTEWGSVLTSCDVDGLVAEFFNYFNSTIAKFSPVFNQPRSNRLWPKWYTPEIKQLLKNQKNLRNRSRNSNSDYYSNKITLNRAKLEKLMGLAHRDYNAEMENSFFTQPKLFWKFVNEDEGENTNFESMTSNGSLIKDDNFASHFASYFSQIYGISPPPSPNPGQISHPYDLVNDCLFFSEISEGETADAIDKLIIGKSPGPDRVPPFLVKGCKDPLLKPLTKIFNLSITNNQFPSQWKISKVCPGYKNVGSVTEISNYRPIAITSTFSKVFETILYNRLLPHVKPYLSEYQYGFLPNRSTLPNLANFTQDVLDGLDDGLQTDTIYTDFEKAFDRVSHQRLLLKLDRYGLHERTLAFMRSYLVNRTQYVNFQRQFSAPYVVNSGVPQGSNLGPLLFLLQLDDIKHVITRSKFSKFADDLRLRKLIKSPTDCEDLQSDLDRIYEWSQENSLLFNIDKCKVMSFSRSHNPILWTYTMNSLPLARITEVKDLGITFTNDLDFSTHIIQIVNNATKSLGFIKANSKNFSNPIVLKNPI